MAVTMIERLIDSVIIIDHLNGIKKATRYLLDLDPTKAAISVITRAEVLAGLEEENKDNVKALLDMYLALIIDVSISDLAADLRKKYRWKPPDAFQAALALHHKIKFSTRNTKDFDPKVHEFVEVPYKI